VKIVVIASDHNGVDQKEEIKSYLIKQGLKVLDLGPYDVESVDYNVYAKNLAKIIQNKEADNGILICGTGVGMSIVANRLSDVRAVLAHNDFTTLKSREHNDTNVLCLGSWISSVDEMKQYIDSWLAEEWAEGRHWKRVGAIDKSLNEIVLTNGVFDILHSGHINLLEFAKSQGKRLIVAIDTDERVKTLKGDERPINNLSERIKVVNAIKYVDEVISFSTKEELIDIYNLSGTSLIVRGSEWTEKEIRERDSIPKDIKIKIYPHYKNFSTTEIVEKIKKNN
jgi:ribose 5-phosphate isomerase B